MSDIKNRVLKVIGKQLDKDPSQVEPEHRFAEDLETDSLDRVELVMALEEEFGIEISDDAAEKIITVKDAIQFIKDNQAK